MSNYSLVTELLPRLPLALDDLPDTYPLTHMPSINSRIDAELFHQTFYQGTFKPEEWTSEAVASADFMAKGEYIAQGAAAWRQFQSAIDSFIETASELLLDHFDLYDFDLDIDFCLKLSEQGAEYEPVPTPYDYFIQGYCLYRSKVDPKAWLVCRHVTDDGLLMRLPFRRPD